MTSFLWIKISWLKYFIVLVSEVMIANTATIVIMCM